jgi:hypothetical protein
MTRSLSQGLAKDARRRRKADEGEKGEREKI